jgi:hypothetical protein
MLSNGLLLPEAHLSVEFEYSTVYSKIRNWGIG